MMVQIRNAIGLILGLGLLGLGVSDSPTGGWSLVFLEPLLGYFVRAMQY